MRRTILLADDSPTIQRLVKQTFADGDFEILTVSNGDAAIRKFEEVRPDVVLADIYMPGKNGFEVCAYVKAQGSSVPVILLVGAFDVFDETAARAVGAAADITKPFEASALVDLVMSLLAKSGAETANSGEGTVSAAPPPHEQPLQNAAVPDTVPAAEPNEDDLLGLEHLFKEQQPARSSGSPVLTDDDIERIVDRVIQKMSAEVIESIAWDVVPDITERVLREELKRNS